MYQGQVLGAQVLPNTGSSNVAFIVGVITILVGVAVVATTLLRIVVKRKSSKA